MWLLSETLLAVLEGERRLLTRHKVRALLSALVRLPGPPEDQACNQRSQSGNDCGQSLRVLAEGDQPDPANDGETTNDEAQDLAAPCTGTVYPRRCFHFVWPGFYGLILDFDPTVFSDLESVRVHE